jgi:hypothetical protein
MIFFVWYLILPYKANSKLVLLYNEVTSTHKPNGFFEVTSPLYFFLVCNVNNYRVANKFNSIQFNSKKLHVHINKQKPLINSRKECNAIVLNPLITF